MFAKGEPKRPKHPFSVTVDPNAIKRAFRLRSAAEIMEMYGDGKLVLRALLHFGTRKLDSRFDSTMLETCLVKKSERNPYLQISGNRWRSASLLVPGVKSPLMSKRAVGLLFDIDILQVRGFSFRDARTSRSYKLDQFHHLKRWDASRILPFVEKYFQIAGVLPDPIEERLIKLGNKAKLERYYSAIKFEGRREYFSEKGERKLYPSIAEQFSYAYLKFRRKEVDNKSSKSKSKWQQYNELIINFFPESIVGIIGRNTSDRVKFEVLRWQRFVIRNYGVEYPLVLLDGKGIKVWEPTHAEIIALIMNDKEHEFYHTKFDIGFIRLPKASETKWPFTGKVVKLETTARLEREFYDREEVIKVLVERYSCNEALVRVMLEKVLLFSRYIYSSRLITIHEIEDLVQKVNPKVNTIEVVYNVIGKDIGRFKALSEAMDYAFEKRNIGFLIYALNELAGRADSLLHFDVVRYYLLKLPLLVQKTLIEPETLQYVYEAEIDLVKLSKLDVLEIHRRIAEYNKSKCSGGVSSSVKPADILAGRETEREGGVGRC